MAFSKLCLSVLFCLFCWISVHAQRAKDTITPEKLIITKQYNPSVNDANKLKKLPSVEEVSLPSQKSISYSILQVPVASTFTPAKGRAGNVRLPSEELGAYNSIARVGAGNFTSILAEFFSALQWENAQQMQVGFQHFSSQGGIDEVRFDDNFATNALQLMYTKEEKSFSWDLHGGMTYHAYNYYGVPLDVAENFTEEIGDLGQHYLGFNVGGELDFYDAVFEKISLDFNNFSDGFESSENRFLVQPQINFSIREQLVENQLKLDYVAGSFQNQTISDFSYAWLITSYHPSIQLNEDRFSVQLGADFTYLSDLENQDGSIYVYPKLEGSYRINENNLIAFGGVDGGMDQNSYQGFSIANPFIAPFSAIAPTNRQYDAFLGIKGGSYGLSFSTKLSFTSAENNPFFTINGDLQPSFEAFNFRNAFAITYDDVTTTAVDVEVAYTLNSKLNLGMHANYSSYNTGTIAEAWNLPNLAASLYANYKITDKWSLAGSLFYIGERKDLAFPDLASLEAPEVTTLDGFVDVNFSVQYKINDQLQAFLDAKNLVGGNYQRWINYPVQGLQILGGVSFQFDW